MIYEEGNINNLPHFLRTDDKIQERQCSGRRFESSVVLRPGDWQIIANGLGVLSPLKRRVIFL